MWPTFFSLATEALILVAIVGGPWAFGSTEAWAIRATNTVGYALGVLWLANNIFRRRNAARVAGSTMVSREQKLADKPFFRRALLVSVSLLLLYCFLSAWNARAVYHLWWLEYRPFVSWLPHSYDQQRSWDFFGKYLGLAGFFLGTRDWLLSAPRRSGHFPERLRRLLWILSINGALLALEGLAQRLTDQDKLLWYVVPGINKTADTQFGPFAYRANAAQYFNLLWPLSLAFWLYLRQNVHHDRITFWECHRQKFLLAGVLLMALCPAVALSRAGCIVLVIALLLAGAIVWLALRRNLPRIGVGIALAAVAVIGCGFLLEGDHLAARFQQLDSGYRDPGRASLYAIGWQMAADNQPFGVGAGAFSSMYQFYRQSFQDPWPAQMHNDWLETVITLGWSGLVLSLLPFGVILLHWFVAGGIRARWPVVALIWVALGGCLAHACVDFPFQIESILLLFTLLCCLLSVFAKCHS